MIERDLEDVLAETEISARPVSPEMVLWSAVIERCFLDAFEVSNIGLADGKRYRLRPESNFDADAERAECRRWLTSDLDPWREAREAVCDAANLDPDKIKTIARQRLAKAKAEEAKAEAEGRKIKRGTRNSRDQRRFDVRFEEHPEDIARMEELAKLDEEHRAAELSERGRQRSLLYWEGKRQTESEEQPTA